MVAAREEGRRELDSSGSSCVSRIKVRTRRRCGDAKLFSLSQASLCKCNNDGVPFGLASQSSSAKERFKLSGRQFDIRIQASVG